jgi:hypothetical protein
MDVSGRYQPNELAGISLGKGDVQLPFLIGLAESMKKRPRILANPGPYL